MVGFVWLWWVIACAPVVEVDTALDCWWCAETDDTSSTTSEDTGANDSATESLTNRS